MHACTLVRDKQCNVKQEAGASVCHCSLADGVYHIYSTNACVHIMLACILSLHKQVMAGQLAAVELSIGTWASEHTLYKSRFCMYVCMYV